MKMTRLLLILLACGLAAGAWGSVEPLSFSSPEAERRYKNLIEELRCLVCQNQNLAASDADLAKDLRRETYNMVEEGKTEGEVIDFMVDRYGDFVLYRPPVKSTTLLLWLTPLLLALAGLTVLFLQIRKRKAASASSDEALSAEEQARLDNLLDHSPSDSRDN
ncbi:MAG: cytochrome c-type biogenesis protein [Gammaproteobacteria bacterium]|nr:cytochrome c-type biogenesis protein [Gammaproteobacteria bacterium]